MRAKPERNKHAHARRRQHEQPLRDLDEPAAVVAVGERARIDRNSGNGTQWLMTAKPASDGE
jgi:hypothetical protein